MTTRRNFFQWAGGLLAAAFAPKLPAPQSTAASAAEFSGLVVTGSWSALDPVDAVIQEIINRSGWVNTKAIYLADDEWESVLGFDARLYSGAKIDSIEIQNSDGEWVSVHSYDAKDKPPRLEIEYHSPAASDYGQEENAVDEFYSDPVIVRSDAAVKTFTLELPPRATYAPCGTITVTNAPN